MRGRQKGDQPIRDLKVPTVCTCQACNFFRFVLLENRGS